ncbi:MAG: hypothetical protein ACI9N1_001632 [Flavobacteriales bacterium]|jgi:hypothetical protein
MDENNLSVKYYLLKKEGMEYSQIRKELKEQGLEEFSIKSIIKEIDYRIIKDVKSKAARSKSIELLVFGIVVLTLGLIITIGTYTRWIDMGNNVWISIGLLIGGFTTISIGYKRLKSS